MNLFMRFLVEKDELSTQYLGVAVVMNDFPPEVRLLLIELDVRLWVY